MPISLHRFPRIFMEFLFCRVRSSFPEQGVTNYNSYTLQRCVTLPMRDQLLVVQPGVLSRPQFHDVRPSSWSKPITAPFATPACLLGVHHAHIMNYGNGLYKLLDARTIVGR